MNKSQVWPGACALVMAFLLVACDTADPDAAVSYSIVITSSGAQRAAPFAGTYEYVIDGQRATRDLTGEGTRTIIFDAQDLAFVRLHGSSAESIYNLAISREGVIIFESKTVAGRQPILYHSRTSAGASRDPADT